MPHRANDTIAAVSSPPSQGFGAVAQGVLPRAILRISGPQAFALADSVFTVAQPERIQRRIEKSVRKIHATLAEAAVENRWRRIAGRVIWRGHELAAHAYIMPAPRSYTREDVAELHLPALPWLIDNLLDALLQRGARAAQPGEFTRRAFEHGRITLEQAEAVGKLIASASADEARAHAANLVSHSSGERTRLKADLEDLLSKVELGLDFAHEDVVVISAAEIATRLNALQDRAKKLAGASVSAEAESTLSKVPRIVLAGPTNAGKSRLFNALLKREAAIVSAQRHTTRDAVEANLSFVGKDGAVVALLVDSAGSAQEEKIEPSNSLNDAGWNATLKALRLADVLVLALDRSISVAKQEGLNELLDALKILHPAKTVLCWTKCDLPAAQGWLNEMSLTAADAIEFRERFEVSSLTGAGIENLRAYLAQTISELSSRTANAHASAGAAIRAGAREAAEALERAAEALRDASGEDVVAVELREALHALWRTEGILIRHDALTEVTLDKIFAEFCIGK